MVTQVEAYVVPLIVSSGAVLCIGVVIAGLSFYLLLRRLALSLVIRSRLRVIQEAISDFEHRAQVVNSVAGDYFLTLGKDGTESVFQIRREIANVKCLCADIAWLVTENSWNSLMAAENLLVELASGYEKQTQPCNTTTAASWEKKIEGAIQELGRKIVRVAATSGFKPEYFSKVTAKNLRKLANVGIIDQRLLAA